MCAWGDYWYNCQSRIKLMKGRFPNLRAVNRLRNLGYSYG